MSVSIIATWCGMCATALGSTCGVSVFSGRAAAPGAAVDKDLDRRAGFFCRIDIEFFDNRRAISKTLRFTQTLARLRAEASHAALHIAYVRRIDRLIIGVIERWLVVIEVNPWALHASCTTLRMGNIAENTSGSSHCAGRCRANNSATVMVGRHTAYFLTMVLP